MSFAPESLSLRQLQYAVAVADTLNFRRAAELCMVSQPALSAQLHALEIVLSVRLFERDRRRVLVTQAGAPLIARARQLLRDTQDLRLAARRLADPFTGSLRVGVIPTVSPYLLPHIAPALAAAFPQLTVLWTEDKTATLVDHLQAGSCDAALLALEADVGALAHQVIAEDAFVLAAPPGHPALRGRGAAKVEMLTQTEVLLLDEGHCLRDQALAFCATANIRERTFRATSLSTLVQMVAAGAGVTFLPALAAATEAERGNIKLRAFAPPRPHRTLALVWRPTSPCVAVLQRLATTIKQHYPTPRLPTSER